MADHVEVMIAAVAVAILVMYFASEPVAAFIERHPTTKMLALSFLLLIGAALIADGFHFHIPRGYIYFAMAFAAGVEVVNVIAMRRRQSDEGGGAGQAARQASRQTIGQALSFPPPKKSCSCSILTLSRNSLSLAAN